jgi:phage terminase Nu1 subunit (DNA packaging protein)
MADLIIRGRPHMAEIVGVTVNGLVRMEQRGLPVLKKSTGASDATQYHLPTVVQWLKEDQARQLLDAHEDNSITEINRRRAKAEARRAEIEVAKMEGSLADIELLRKGLDGVMINQRSILLGLPAQIGREIDEPEIRVRVVAVVDRRVREALEAIADYDPLREPDDAGGESDDADPVESASDPPAAKAQHKPVGRAKKVSQPRRRSVRPVEERHRTLSP